jgi:hypothetical protein
MIVFIDESGDAGFKISKGSSPNFVIAMAIFKDELVAEETALSIKKLRKKLGYHEHFEFKFNKCNKSHRELFFNTVKPYDFSIRAIVFNKAKLYSSHLRETKNDFYSFALRMVLEHNDDMIKNAKIRLNGSGEKSFRQQLTTYLRKSLNTKNSRIMQNLRFRDSSQDVLIQLADMIAGSIRRYYDKSTLDWNVYRKLLKTKEDDIWLFK